jgi:hypothetical protein
LIAFRRRYGIHKCRFKGKCRIHQFLLDATRSLATGLCGRAAARVLGQVRALPQSMFQTRCECQASRQPVPPIPFSAHRLIAELLPIPEGEAGPMRLHTRPNKNRGRAAFRFVALSERRATASRSKPQ